MSNLTDFIGAAYGGGKELPSVITDGVHQLPSVTNTNYIDLNSFAILNSAVINVGNYDPMTVGTSLLTSRYISEKNIYIPNSETIIPSNGTGSFQSGLCMEMSKLNLRGVIAVRPSWSNPGTPTGPCGTQGNPGTNILAGAWDFMPKGGSGSGANGGVGFSGGESSYGNGGGLIFIIADSISGNGTIEARGGVYNGSESGGGGIVIILTKSWSGLVSVDVGANAGASAEGSFCILRINANNSLTLMVHSENGVSASLNGQSPVYGADASISW